MTDSINVYQFQTVGGRKFNIKSTNQYEAEKLALEWRDINAPKCSIAYNFMM